MAGKFTSADIFVVETTGQKTNRKTRLMVPVSNRETGQAGTILDQRKNTGLATFQLKAKFLFSSTKPDSVALTCEIELPAGMSLNQPLAISVGVGNVLGSANVDAKGHVTAKSKYLKSLAVKWPTLVKKDPVTKKPVANPVTKAGDKAKLTITLTGSSLHEAGFDTEGIVNTVDTGKKGIDRYIQTAIVLGGVS